MFFLETWWMVKIKKTQNSKYILWEKSLVALRRWEHDFISWIKVVPRTIRPYWMDSFCIFRKELTMKGKNNQTSLKRILEKENIRVCEFSKRR